MIKFKPVGDRPSSDPEIAARADKTIATPGTPPPASKDASGKKAPKKPKEDGGASAKRGDPAK